MTFIRGDLFAEMADFIYTDVNVDGDNEKFPNSYDPAAIEAFDGIPIIYSANYNTPVIVDLVGQLNKQIILVTHSNDWAVDEAQYKKLPPNVIRWFCNNVKYKGERIQSVPLGLETVQRYQFHHIQKIAKMQAKAQQEKTRRNVLFICHSTWTNKEERIPPYQILGGRPYVTAVEARIFDFDNYIDNIYHHQFMVSPEGSGVDCHRTWEALYLDTIPVMKKCVNTSFIEDLPILFIDKWEQLTKEFLEAEYNRIINTAWNMDKMDFHYWRREIERYTK